MHLRRRGPLPYPQTGNSGSRRGPTQTGARTKAQTDKVSPHSSGQNLLGLSLRELMSQKHLARFDNLFPAPNPLLFSRKVANHTKKQCFTTNGYFRTKSRQLQLIRTFKKKRKKNYPAQAKPSAGSRAASLRNGRQGARAEIRLESRRATNKAGHDSTTYPQLVFVPSAGPVKRVHVNPASRPCPLRSSPLPITEKEQKKRNRKRTKLRTRPFRATRASTTTGGRDRRPIERDHRSIAQLAPAGRPQSVEARRRALLRKRA